MAALARRVNPAWAGIALIAVMGLVHLAEAPEYFGIAAYLGLLFLVNAAGAAVAAYGIYRGKDWGWALGLVLAGGAFIAYVISRTLGLPGLSGAAFFELIGIVSLLAEGGFVALAVRALSGRTAEAGTRRVS